MEYVLIGRMWRRGMFRFQGWGQFIKLARHTIIFLGEGTPELDFITDVLKNPNPTFDETHDSAYLSNVSRLFVAEFNKLHLEEDAKTYSGRQSLSDEVRNHTEVEILRRVWFTRIWALQELVMSPDP
jgi:hypothetical protein